MPNWPNVCQKIEAFRGFFFGNIGKIRNFVPRKRYLKMINRELIRTKVVQLVYAYYQNSDSNIDTAEKELLFSLDKAYELYNNLLLLIVAISKEEQRRVEILSRSARREGKAEPSRKFADNRFALQLADNEALLAFTESGKCIWDDQVDMVRRLCTLVETSDTYKEYMEAEADSYDADREVWRKLYRQLIETNADIDELLEDRSLYWNDDKEIIDTFVLKTIRRFDPEAGTHQELLPEYKEGSDDRDFARRLFRATILGGETYRQYMNDASLNWDLSRLAYMDIVIMQIAIAEMLTFGNIPVNVTISEYIELAKLYSTPRSGGYINGVLDNIAHFLVDKGLMLKTLKPQKDKEPTANVAPAND